MNTMTIETIRNMTNEEFKNFTKGQFFSVEFIKKDNTLRTYSTARVNVTKDTVGGHNNVEHKKNLVTVYLPHEKRNRATLNLQTVKRISIKGNTYE